MQLKLQRSQRMGGAFGNVVIFCLDARAEYSPTEAANIGKYKLGGQVVYNSQAARRHLEHAEAHLDRTQQGGTGERAMGLMRGAASLALAQMRLNISIASLGRGHRIECKDLAELLEAEAALMDACRSLRGFLQVAATFNGSVVLVDFDDGEKVQIAHGAPELAVLPAPAPDPDPEEAELGNETPPPVMPSGPDAEQLFADIWSGVRRAYELNPRTFAIGGSIAATALMVVVFGIVAGMGLSAIFLAIGSVLWTPARR